MDGKAEGGLAAGRVASEGDDRTANNAVRHTYRILSDAEKQQMVELKDMGAAFISKCNAIGKSRELSLAVTNAEQAVMWAVKHVTARSMGRSILSTALRLCSLRDAFVANR